MRHLFCDRKLLTPLPDIYFYTPYLPSTYFAAERFQACALQLPDIEVLGLLFLTAPHSDTACIYSKYIYWDCGKRRGLYFPCRVLLSPMSRYDSTDVWTFLKPMAIIEYMKMMQMPYLDIRSMKAHFFLDKVP